VQNCSPPSGGVTLIDQQTGETSSGPVFSYTAEQPIVSGASPALGAQAGGDTISISGTFSTVETNQTVLIGGVQATVDSTSSTATALTVTSPPFTGTFNTVTCGVNGTQQVPTAVDVQVLYPGSGCSGVATGAFTYQPDQDGCVDVTPPSAVFSFVVDDATLTVTFTDLSVNEPTSWLWDFGDGSAASIEQNPIHTYTEAGEYTVTLQATNAGGTGSIQQQVSVGTEPDANFTFDIGGTVSPPPPCDLNLYVQFTDTSTGNPTSWMWTFGDGETSEEQNPSHCYASAGVRTVTLSATNGLGSDSISMIVTVN